MTTKTWMILIAATLLFATAAPIATADPDDGSPGAATGGTEDVPCYYVDTSYSPPRVYEVPC